MIAHQERLPGEFVVSILSDIQNLDGNGCGKLAVVDPSF